MKTILSLFAAAAVLGFASPSNAKAEFQGETRIVGYTSFGTPIVAVYQITGYNGYGQPIGQWVTQGSQYGYSGMNPVYVQPNINLGVGVGGYGCNPVYGNGYGYGFGHHHHHGFDRR